MLCQYVFYLKSALLLTRFLALIRDTNSIDVWSILEVVLWFVEELRYNFGFFCY